MTDTQPPAYRKGVPDPRCKVYCAGHSCGRWCDEHVCGEYCPSTLSRSMDDCDRTYADLEREYVKAREREANLRADLRKAISIYFDVDADNDRTDGGELELADAIRALEAVRDILSRE